MTAKVGIRREDKNIWEARVPLTPGHVAELVRQGVEVIVQPSEVRTFPDDAYRQVGARIEEDLSNCPVVLAVKEIPQEYFQTGHAYVFFAHVIKGQEHNMPMLRRLLEKNCTLIDYEKVVDDQGRRLIFFGRHAGLAGMMDTLWTLGRRLQVLGHITPFASLQPTHSYANLDEVKAAVSQVGEIIGRESLPAGVSPLVFGFSGYGNVSRGAQEIFDLLPHRLVDPDDLLNLPLDAQSKELIKVVFHEEHMARPKDPKSPFQLQEYYDHPERYEANFSRFVPRLSVLVNCIYWSPAYPRLVTRELLREMWMSEPRLYVIGDISCDVEGAVECTLKSTEPDDPVYVYSVANDSIHSGVEGDGPVVLAVDNLPCELPAESSADFGEALMPFLPAIAGADYTQPFGKLLLPEPIKRAVVAHRGELTPDYGYLADKLG